MGGSTYKQKATKTVASAGSAIATITAVGSTNMEAGSCTIEFDWYDTAWASGVGRCQVAVSVYQDSAVHYRQNIVSPMNVYAGNGMSTAPTFSLSRTGNVWSIVMTPAYNDITLKNIVMTYRNYAGMTFDI